MTQTRPRRRPLTHQEKLALQERKQRCRENGRERTAKGPIDLTFCLLVMLLTAIGLVILLSASFPPPIMKAPPPQPAVLL